MSTASLWSQLVNPPFPTLVTILFPSLGKLRQKPAAARSLHVLSQAPGTGYKVQVPRFSAESVWGTCLSCPSCSLELSLLSHPLVLGPPWVPVQRTGW